MIIWILGTIRRQMTIAGARTMQPSYQQTTITQPGESQSHEIQAERAVGIQGSKWIERVVKSAVR